jgi:ABC-type oligopeptide transport system substrate-binding subunit
LGLDEWREKQKNQKQSQYQEIPKGLKKIDDTHLEILLAVPNPQILHAFATVALAILPKELAAESFNKWESENIGTGPYQVNSKMEKGNIELQRRKDYWNAEEQGPPVILAKYFGSEAVKLSAFEHKEIDIMQLGKGSLKQFINPETKSLVEEKKSLKLSEKSLLDVVYVGFNMEDPTIKKLGANFRKAISLAIDKNYYNIAMNEGAGVLAQSPVPPGISGYKAEYNNRYAQFDVEKAKDFLKKSNIKTEKLSALKFESLNTPEALKFAEVFKNNLSQIGIGMEIITNPDVNSIMEKIRSKEAQMWLLSWQADYPDAENFLQLLYGPNRTPSPNFSNFDDPVFNKLFTKMRLLAESPERNKAIEEMMNLFVRNAPWVPLIHRTEFYVSHPNIEGFFPKQFGSSHYKTVKISVPAQ